MSRPLILAVDDDVINLEIIAAALEGNEIDLRFAKAGSEALALLADERLHFDAVVLDRMMPGIDGLAVLRHIKASARLTGTPVVMQTAAAAPDQVEEGLRSGAYYYLTKPYSPVALRTIVRTALETGRLLRRRAEGPPELQALRLARSASFVIRTLSEGSELAALLALLCPDTGTARMGLSELLVNAVEHGNLELSYAEKTRLKQQQGWLEEIERRLQLPQYSARRVHIAFVRKPGELSFVISDEGRGFDCRPYLDFDPARAFDPNGRGIALAKSLAFSTLRYEGRGNVVTASVALTAD